MIGAELVEVRKQRGLSAYRLAKEIGITPQHMYMLETGRRVPNDETPGKLAEVLGVPFERLRALADATRLGDERLQAIRQHVFNGGVTWSFGTPPARSIMFSSGDIDAGAAV